jgi:hypothetical protein
MAAARSLSLLLPLAPPAIPTPALFSRSAAPLRARNVGGGFGRGATARRLPLAKRLRPVAAAYEDVEQTEEMMRVAADDDSITATVVSALLTVAFVGLSLLTIGVGDAFVGLLELRCWIVLFFMVVPDYL